MVAAAAQQPDDRNEVHYRSILGSFLSVCRIFSMVNLVGILLLSFLSYTKAPRLAPRLMPRLVPRLVPWLSIYFQIENAHWFTREHLPLLPRDLTKVDNLET